MFARVLLICAGLTIFQNAAIGQSQTLEERITRLEAAYSGLLDTQKNQLDALDQLVKRNESGGYTLSFNTNSQDARREIRRAVRVSAPEWGKLIVHNKMGSGQWIIVNDRRYYVDAYGRASVDVKLGTTTTQLPGQQPMTWAIASPGYKQEIDIRPNWSPPIYERIIYSSEPYYYSTIVY